MRLESGIAQALWLVAVTGMFVFVSAFALDELFGFSPRWLEAAGLVAWAAALPALIAFLLLYGRARLRGRRSA